jgi:predicted TIM-barrel fold metal-dependent hydrolase
MGTAYINVDQPLMVVSADTHVGPRLMEDLRLYCPSKLLDDFDRFAAANGVTADIDVSSDWVAPTHPNLTAAVLPTHPNFATAGHYSSKARLADYDYDGVAAGVIFHGSQNMQPVPFMPTVWGAPIDTELATVGQQIYDRWLADFVSESPHRHIGLAQLPMWDIDLATAELESAYEAGLRGVNFPAVREGLILEYNNRAWEPFWSACEERRMPLVTHVAGGTNARYEGPEAMMLVSMEPGGWMARRAIWWLIFGGVFERHPALKLVITETPGNWWPAIAAELDSIYDMVALKGRQMMVELFEKQIPRRPSEYMATNVYFGASFTAPFEAEQAILNDVDRNLLWGSDYPHVEGTFVYPNGSDLPSVTRLSLRNTFHAIPAEQTQRMVGENAIEVFNLDKDALQAVANQIGAPTLTELSQPIEAVPEGVSHLAFRSASTWT